MSHDLHTLPELATRHSATELIRLPPGTDVPLTPRVRRLIDTPAMRRLSGISQLGLVRLVYPGAGHSRLEHSIGVYGVALEFLTRLSSNDRFSRTTSAVDAEHFLAAALLHDVGHWPYCHPLEDIRLEGLVDHESLAREAITQGPVAEALEKDWKIDPSRVADLIEGVAESPSEKILRSMLSGPIDVDKIDYLARDSLHAGVPYGRNFDPHRLVASLCLNEAGDAIAISDKGKTAAELMVFARYVMFSEVYWHHAVRSATAMLQRAVYSVCDKLDWPALYLANDEQWGRALTQSTGTQSTGAQSTGASPSAELVSGIFGAERKLYKRLAQYSLLESPEIYKKLARQPYAWLVGCAERLADVMASQIGSVVAPHEILLDTPPMKLEVQFNIEVYSPKRDRYRPLGDVSPVVKTLAREQFDDYVKRVRVFAHPRIAPLLREADIDHLVSKAIGEN